MACALPLPARDAAPLVALATDDGAVATISVDGGPVTIISPPPATGEATGPFARRYHWPAWSPDGRRIAFIVQSGRTGAVMVANPDGRDQVMVEEFNYGLPIYLSWSPDGHTLAMLTTDEISLYLVLGAADGRRRGRVLYSGQPIYSSWSPDGQALLIHSGGIFPSTSFREVYEVPVEEGRPITRIDIEPNAFRAPAWSPSGAFQLFSGDNGMGRSALFLRDRRGSLRRFDDVSGPPAIIWTRAGDRFAWSSRVGVPYYYDGLNVATPDGRTRLRLTDDRLFAYFWSPDGAHIAYITRDDAGEAMQWRVIPAAGGASRLVASFQPSVAFLQVISLFDQYAQSNAPWSPDGHFLLFAGWPSGGDTASPSAIHVVAVNGSAPVRPLTNGRVGFFAPPAPLATATATPGRR